MVGKITELLLGLRRKNIFKNKTIQKTKKIKTIKIEHSFSNTELYFSNAQHIGKREEQQDSFAISDFKDERLSREKGVFFVVADGMGGLDNGREASNIVVESMMKYFVEKPFISPIPIELRNMVENSNEKLLDYFQTSGNGNSGSTVVAIVIKDSQLFWISLGDSRIYLYRQNAIYTFNRDHNYGLELANKVIEGRMNSDEALNHPDRKALISYMGISELKHIDQNIKPFKLMHGDKILLCSDGIYGSLDEEEIIEVLNGNTNCEAEELKEKVLKKDLNDQDNMTAVVIVFN